MERSQTPPEEYLASLAPHQRPDVEQLDALLKRILAKQARTMWEGELWGGTHQQIIGYGEYSYQRSDGKTVEWFMVGLTAQKNYVSIYVNATDSGGYITQRWTNRLGKVKVGASSISFKSVDDIDLDALSNMITEVRELTS